MTVLFEGPVRSRETWADTGIVVEPEQTLIFAATGTWRDWTIEKDANGFDRWYLDWLKAKRRLPTAPWFSLVGALDRDLSTAWAIGTGGSRRMDRGGRLFVFANDVPWAYFNNSGAIVLKITAP